MKYRLIDLDKFLDDFYGNDVYPKAIIPLVEEIVEKKKQELFEKYGVDVVPVEFIKEYIEIMRELKETQKGAAFWFGAREAGYEMLIRDWREVNE